MNDLCQSGLKLAQWFFKKFLHVVNVITLLEKRRNLYFKHTQGGFVASLAYQNVNSLATDGPRMDNKREENIA